MAHGQFTLSDTNPNDVTGGGGCVCDPIKQTDCKGPFAVFYGNDMESTLSPHVVVCQACFNDLTAAFNGKKDVLAAGEKSPVDVVLDESDVVEYGPEPEPEVVVVTEADLVGLDSRI